MTEGRLQYFQKVFRGYLYTGRGEDELASQVRTGSRMDSQDRLSVYRNGYFIRLEKALAHDFPATRQAIGEDRFARAAGKYVLNNPSRSPTLRELGRSFASWLRKKEGSELGDLADIEWALMEAFDGPDADPVGPNVMTDFSSEDWPYLRVVCSPTLTLLSCTSNAHEFWKSVKHGGSTELTSALTTYLAIWRSAKGPTFHVISCHTYLAMKTLQAVPELAGACDKLSGSLETDTVPNVLATGLQQALHLGCISHVSKKT